MGALVELNTSVLIRLYFPRKADFTMIANEQVLFVMERLSKHPRKCFAFKTSNRILAEVKPKAALAT